MGLPLEAEREPQSESARPVERESESEPQRPAEPAPDSTPTAIMEKPPGSVDGPRARTEPQAVSEPNDPLLGTLVGDRYRVIKVLGSGGMGSVYLAEHVHMKKNVALKILHRSMSAKPEVVARFEREAFVSGQIEHPNVAQATDFGQLEDGTCYLVLELLEGRSLGDAIRDASMSVDMALRIAGQVAEALSAAHQQGVVHRDLKPENIMLLPRENGLSHVKVVDFGVAKLASSGSGGLTLAGMIFGTPKYMAPEQAAGQAVDHRADLYALGVVLYELLVGHPPFDGREVRQVLAMHLTQEVPPLPETIPERVRALTMALLDKDPEGRIQTANEVVDLIVAELSSDSLPLGLPLTRMQAVSSSRTPDLGRGEPVSEARASSGVTFAVLLGLLVALVVGLSIGLGPKGFLSAARPPSSAAPIMSAEFGGGEADPVKEKLLEGAIKGEASAVKELEEKPASERGVREWSALARGLSKQKRDAEALRAYQALLELDPGSAEDASIITYVWRMANALDTSKLALDLAAQNLGSRGADLIYHVWVGKSVRNSITEDAERLAKTEAVREAASPALKFAIELRLFEDDCAALAEVLPRGTLHGDSRAFHLLQKLKGSNTCDLSVEALDAALVAVKERPAPQPF